MKKTIVMPLLACVLAGFLAACEREGPAEEAGESIDRSMSNAGERMENAGEAMEDAAEDAVD